jgi:cation diffusion facilitator CzcD-associated flavoprotein CzcO
MSPEVAGPSASADPAAVTAVDVLIVGAGLSGIGAACLLRQQRPGATFAILEARDAIGGTWDLFRYPGIRSDSDMFTLGYSFRPWDEAQAIADGPSILEYIRDTAREYGVDGAVRFGHRVVDADWDSGTARWLVTARRADGSTARFSCLWLSVCSGYYDYSAGYRPALPGEDAFEGVFVHPQQWPADLDWTGRRVVVIGSGATAVTLVPALAERAAHVTMLQRTPSYIVSLPARDPLAEKLLQVLPRRAAHAVVRWKGILLNTASYQFARRQPERMKAFVSKGIIRALPHGYDVARHFTPPYDPWDQRLCLVPDGDLFKALRAGRAEIVTDQIDTFTPGGVRLRSGRVLDADIVITATGLNVLALGGMRLRVDGAEVDLARTVAYKGMMLSGVPNFNLVIGYTNNSWTLKADLVNRYVIRLLKYLDRHGYDRATPVVPAGEPADQPFLDFQAGYVLRAVDRFPRQGRRAPWRLYQNYLRDVLLMRYGRLRDGAIQFGSSRSAADRESGDAAARVAA